VPVGPTPTDEEALGPVARTYPESSGFSFRPIHELNEPGLALGSYDTEGYVSKIFTCPPCPPRADCKPCMEDNVVLSESEKVLESYTLSSADVIVYAKQPRQLELGHKYTMSVTLSPGGSPHAPKAHVALVGYGPPRGRQEADAGRH
jgi:hypothetical protein